MLGERSGRARGQPRWRRGAQSRWAPLRPPRRAQSASRAPWRGSLFPSGLIVGTARARANGFQQVGRRQLVSASASRARTVHVGRLELAELGRLLLQPRGQRDLGVLRDASGGARPPSHVRRRHAFARKVPPWRPTAPFAPCPPPRSDPGARACSSAWSPFGTIQTAGVPARRCPRARTRESAAAIAAREPATRAGAHRRDSLREVINGALLVVLVVKAQHDRVLHQVLQLGHWWAAANAASPMPRVSSVLPLLTRRTPLPRTLLVDRVHVVLDMVHDRHPSDGAAPRRAAPGPA